MYAFVSVEQYIMRVYNMRRICHICGSGKGEINKDNKTLGKSDPC